MKQPRSHQAIKHLIPPLAAWVVGRILDAPRVKDALQEVDSRAYIRQRSAARAVRRVGKNAASNRAWVAAGAAAIAVGIGLIAKAARGK